MLQTAVLDLLKTGQNVFLTGEPGSGKTHTVNLYIDYLKKEGIGVAVTASTGIAATHLGGLTIHSWSGIGIKKTLTKSDLANLLKKSYLKKRADKTAVLVIDEISMLDAPTLDAVDLATRTLRGSNQPFGGLQVILVGDFFQLPPVTHNQEPASFAYEATSWALADLAICYLSEQHRQADEKFLNLLRQIRQNQNHEDVKQILSHRITDLEIDDTVTRLFSHNFNVDHLNTRQLQTIMNPEKTFTMTDAGNAKIVETLKKNCLSPVSLNLKIGARVMFTKNNFDEGFVNGTLGDVIGWSEAGLPLVKTRSGLQIEVKPMEWVVEDGDKILGAIQQLPLRLAWAITVHKSQGISLDAAVIDLSGAFEYGQGYVALSRIRSLSGLHLMGFNTKSLQVHPKILEIDNLFQNQSAELSLQLEADDKELLHQSHLAWLQKCGAKIKKVKIDTLAETQRLFDKSLNLKQIAKERGLTIGTVLGHLEKLHLQNKIKSFEIARLIPAKLKDSFDVITKVFQKLGPEKIKPIHDHFKGHYSYEDLRLIRMLNRA